MKQLHLSGAHSSDKITKNAWSLSTSLNDCRYPNKDVSTVSVQSQETVALLSENQGIHQRFDLDINNFSVTFPMQGMSGYG